MFKKILLGMVLVAISAFLIYGAVVRTMEKTREEPLAIAGNALVELEGRGGQGVRGGDWENESDAVHEAEPLPEIQIVAPVVEEHELVDVSDIQAGTLDQAEVDGLLYMREEEKLARDVYLKMYALWGQQTFYNIAQSEQAHMDSILTLLEAYGMDDPVSGLESGQFQNTGLQSLYEALIQQGSQSLVEALKVGAAIEEIDILDLRERQLQTDESAILSVYANLESGSMNHLQAFVGVLSARKFGLIYEPQYLTAADYEAIVSSSLTARGNRGNH